MKRFKIALVYGAFHRQCVETMRDAARLESERLNLTIVSEIAVPGAMEKPLAIKKLLMRSDIDGVVVLGIIEKGETKHGLVMGLSVVHSLIQLQCELMKPIGVGILGPDIEPKQIPVRLEPYACAAVRAIHHQLTNQ